MNCSAQRHALSASLLVLMLVAAPACKSGEPCTVVDNGDGTATVSCPDGSSATIAGGADGTSCTVVDNGDGTSTITCGTTETTVSNDGEPCAATDNGDGTVTIACGADSVTIANGADGATCGVVDNGDGTYAITCGADTVTLSDGAAGASCAVADNLNGTYTITCGGGTAVVVTDPGWVPPGYAAADGLAGGTAYSKWWVTTAGGAGTLAGAGVTIGADWVRCKACHAWDGMGNSASYAARTGVTTGALSRPDVSTVDLWTTIVATTPQQLFDLVRGAGGRPLNTQGNGHPDYSTALSDAQIWNLVKFMREEWIYPDALYYLAVDGPPVYRNGAGVVVAPVLTYYGIGADGDAVSGNAIYAATCAGCHGANGTTIDLGGKSLGEFVRTAPHEVWHKAKFGEVLDDSTVEMPAGLLTVTADIADLYRALTDVTAYPDIP